MYLTYDEYTAYGGKMDKSDFDRFSFRAECEINNATLNRCKNLDGIPDEIKRCMFELTTYISKTTENGSNLAVSSFSNDGYSVTYSENKTAQNAIYEIISTYLIETDLMYCGVN